MPKNIKKKVQSVGNTVINEQKGMVSDPNEMKNELERKFEQVKSQNAGLESEKISMKNRIEGIKSELLQDFYKFLQENGVDPNNLESISQFTQKLEAQDPDFVVLLEFLLNGLAPQDGAQEGIVETGSTPNGSVGNSPIGMPSSTSTAVANGNMVGSTPISSGIPANATPNNGSANVGSMFNRFDDLKKRGIV